MNANNDNTYKFLDFNEESKMAIVFYLSIIYKNIGRKIEVKDTDLVVELKDKSKPITRQMALNSIDLAAKLLNESVLHNDEDNIFANLADEFVTIVIATPSHTINDFINMAIELIDDIGYKDLFLKYLVAHWQGAKTDNEKQCQKLLHSLMENALLSKIVPNELKIEEDSADTELQIKTEYEGKSALCNDLIDYCNKLIEESKADNNYSIIVPDIGRIPIGKSEEETSSKAEPPETSSKREKQTFIDILNNTPSLEKIIDEAQKSGLLEYNPDWQSYWLQKEQDLYYFAHNLSCEYRDCGITKEMIRLVFINPNKNKPFNNLRAAFKDYPLTCKKEIAKCFHNPQEPPK